MVELKILSGKQAGASVVARRFPFSIGRSAEADLRLQDEGIFERHLELRLERPEGVVLAVHPDAYAAVNGQTAQQTSLRSGDIISAGSVKLALALSAAPQYSLRFREALVWIGIGLVSIAEVALIYLLLE